MWVLLGVVTAVAAVGLGPILLLPAVAVAGLLVYRRGIKRSLYGILGGLGCLLILSMVWENARTPDAGFALPFALGVLLLVCGVLAQLRRRAAY